MTDKEQKIREEVERLYNQSLADEKRQVERGLECSANVSYGKSKACKELLSFINSLQEEPVSEDERIRKAMIDFFKHEREKGVTVLHYGVNIECMIAWLEKQGEQKPVIEMKTPEESLGVDSDTYNKIVDECVYGEQKSAWSEEEIENCAREAEELNCIILAKHIRQLKSLRPQYTWKPSEEQIIALQWILNNLFYCRYKKEIRGLLEQIKDL